MASQIATLRDAVVAALVAANVEDPSPFSLAFTPAAARVVLVELPTAEHTLVVPVVAESAKSDPETRDTQNVDYVVAVGVLVRPARDNGFAEVDAYVELLEQIRDHLLAIELNLDGGPAEETIQVRPSSASIDPLYDHDRLLKDGLFAGVVRLTYRGQIDP